MSTQVPEKGRSFKIARIALTLTLIMTLLGLCSCAVVRDPIDKQVVFIGWGTVEIDHTVDGQEYHFKRTISTGEALAEMAGFAAAVGGVLAVAL